MLLKSCLHFILPATTYENPQPHAHTVHRRVGEMAAITLHILNNLTTKLQLLQCYKFKLFSLSHPGAVCGRNKYTVVHHSHYDTVRLWLTILSRSDAIRGRNKYTAVHHSHYDTVRLWPTVLSHSDAICGRNKYTAVQHSHYDTVRLWLTILSHSEACSGTVHPFILLLDCERLSDISRRYK